MTACTRPQARHRSGWCPSASASAPTRFTKSRPVLKSGNIKTFSRWCPSTTCQSGSSRLNFSSSAPVSGGVAPRHGAQCLDASLDSPIFPPSLGQIVAIQVHHFVPRSHEVLHKRLLRVAARVNFRERAELGVRTEDEIDTGAGPLDFAR